MCVAPCVTERQPAFSLVQGTELVYMYSTQHVSLSFSFLFFFPFFSSLIYCFWLADPMRNIEKRCGLTLVGCNMIYLLNASSVHIDLEGSQMLHFTNILQAHTANKTVQPTSHKTVWQKKLCINDHAKHLAVHIKL